MRQDRLGTRETLLLQAMAMLLGCNSTPPFPLLRPFAVVVRVVSLHPSYRLFHPLAAAFSARTTTLLRRCELFALLLLLSWGAAQRPRTSSYAASPAEK